MSKPTRLSWTRRLAAAVALAFGVLTLLAGGRILLGLGDAGYQVARPVLVFNTAMGVVYLAAAALVVADARLGRLAAAAVAATNAAVLLVVVLYGAPRGAVARETVAAMVVRTLVWVAIYVALAWERRRHAVAAP